MTIKKEKEIIELILISAAPAFLQPWQTLSLSNLKEKRT